MVSLIENRDYNNHSKGFTVVKWYQPMVGAIHSANTDEVPGTWSNTSSQNKLGYAAITNNPLNPAHTTFPMQFSWECSAIFTETQDACWRLYLCTSMVVKIGLPRLYLKNCQDMGICPLDLKSFYLKAMLSFHCPKQGMWPHLISRVGVVDSYHIPRKGKNHKISSEQF